MPFVLLRVNEEAEGRLSVGLLELIRVRITDILPGNLDPDDDLDVNIQPRHMLAHSKYDMTVDIEAMRTDERAEHIGSITKTIKHVVSEIFGHNLKVNVWIKLVEAGYAPMDED